MAFFLDHLPPHVHVVLSTRADPDLPLSRWRVRGELVEVRAADLRFTSGEAAAYLNEVADSTSPRRTSRRWRTARRGGSRRCSSRRCPCGGATDVSGFIARFAGDDRYIVDYLVEEVLAHQPDPVRDFLSRTAVLDRLTGPLCDAVTGRDDGSGMLVALERANLFVVPLDDRREWYRYHHLFADVLRARLLAEQQDLVPLLHQRASQWYERHDLAEEAVKHALAARDVDRAAYLMELAVPAIRRDRQRGDAARLAEGAARRRRPAQPGAQRLLRSHAHGRRRPRRGRVPARRRRPRAGRRVRTGRRRHGPTPTSSARCRRPSRSTAPRSRRHGATWRAPRNTPGTRWTWPAPPTTSRGPGRPGSSVSPRGRAATWRARWTRSRRPWRACTRPAPSSTS